MLRGQIVPFDDLGRWWNDLRLASRTRWPSRSKAGDLMVEHTCTPSSLRWGVAEDQHSELAPLEGDRRYRRQPIQTRYWNGSLCESSASRACLSWVPAGAAGWLPRP